MSTNRCLAEFFSFSSLFEMDFRVHVSAEISSCILGERSICVLHKKDIRRWLDVSCRWENGKNGLDNRGAIQCSNFSNNSLLVVRAAVSYYSLERASLQGRRKLKGVDRERETETEPKNFFPFRNKLMHNSKNFHCTENLKFPPNSSIQLIVLARQSTELSCCCVQSLG